MSLLIWHVATMLCTMGVGVSSGTVDSPISMLYLLLCISQCASAHLHSKALENFSLFETVTHLARA